MSVISQQEIAQRALKQSGVMPSEFNVERRNDEWIVRLFRGRVMDGVNYRIVSLNSIIFSHEFSRAFWGEHEIGATDRKGRTTTLGIAWQVHIQRLALSTDRIQYLANGITSWT